MHPEVLPLVHNIRPVLFYQITPIGPVFAVVPVMIIAVVPIVDSDLYVGLLSSGFNYDQGWCHNGGGQE
jgi:hypothetical protein